MDTLNLKTAFASNEEGFKYKTGSGVLDWSLPKLYSIPGLYVTCTIQTLIEMLKA